jgi:SAM-dependent methyltransferase
MRNLQDAHGHAAYDYLKGEGGFEIVERDDGFITPTNAPKVYFSKYQDWPSHEKKAMRYAKGRVLDIGCGAGRHAIYLQERGRDVLGIDLSPLAVKVCKLRGLKKAKRLSIDKINQKLGRFDTLLMLGNNFGLFENFNKARRLLRRFHKITSQKARIIAESTDPYQTNEPDHLKYHRYNRKLGRMSGQIKLRVRYKKHVTPWFDYLLVSKDEMREILKGTGWQVKRFFDSKSPWYLAIIEKHSP